MSVDVDKDAEIEMETSMEIDMDVNEDVDIDGSVNVDADDYKYMREAYGEALRALANNEVPVGCVIVQNGRILTRTANERVKQKNALFHAEIIAIHQACEAVGDWRLDDCRLYVTVEPCPMCAGAIIQARIPVVVYGTANPKAGCAGSILNILNEPRFNHQAAVTAGVMEAECRALMRRFFEQFRFRKCPNGSNSPNGPNGSNALNAPNSPNGPNGGI